MNSEADMEWTVLVIDDEVEILRMLKSFLTVHGYRVLTAEDGTAGLEMVRREKIHVTLCDIKLPGRDGIEVLAEIKAIDFSIQVIMITGYSTFDRTLKALEKGATDYVLKPFDDLEDLLELVRLSCDKLTRWKKVLANSSKGK